MYRQMQRDYVPVLSRLDRLRPDDYTWSWVECMVAPSEPLAAVQVSESGFSTNGEINIFTKSPRPTIEIFKGTLTPPHEDYVLWEGDYYATYGTSNWKHIGRNGYRHVICFFDSSNDEVVNFPTEAPDFKEGYTDFLDAVGKVSLAVNLAVCPLANIITEC